MLHRIARELSCASIDELLTRVGSAEQLALWMAEFELDPWGEQRLDWQLAQLTAAVCNKGRTHGFVRPRDVLIKWDDWRQPDEQIDADVAMFRAITERMGGTIQ